MTEAEVTPFGSLLEANNRAKALVKGGFTLGSTDAPEGSQQLTAAFNNFWDLTTNGLHLQLRYFFTNLYRAEQFEPNQLASGPALSICDNINKAKFRIEAEELLSIAEKIYDIEFETVFKLPANKVEDADVTKKRKRIKRQESFEALKLLAFTKVRTMEEEVMNEVETRYEVHRKRLGEVNVDRLLRAGPAGPSAPGTSQASTSVKPSQFKPQESFLGSRKFPWWRTTDSTADPKDLEMVTDYLYSGGTWQNIEQPYMYITKLLCRDTMTGYRKALDKKLDD